MRNWSSICSKMSFDSVPAAVQTGKSDFAARCITISDERAESIKTGSEKGSVIPCSLQKSITLVRIEV